VPLQPKHYNLDHITPRSKGGSDEEHNLRIAHPDCNLKKSDSELDARRMRIVLKELRLSKEEIAKDRLF
jgi:5-methylcytosine-specific restriction endonuclease McrA